MATSGSVPFQQAVQRIFDSWSVLQIAVNNGFGGADSLAKARWMVQAVDQWFTENKDLDVYEVEDFLADILNHEFNAIADDGSLRSIADHICQSFVMIKTGRLQELEEKLEKLPKASRGGHQQVQDDEEESSDDDEAMDATCSSDNMGTSVVPPHAPLSSQEQTDDNESEEKMEDDGWTVVKKGKKR